MAANAAKAVNRRKESCVGSSYICLAQVKGFKLRQGMQLKEARKLKWL